MDNTPPAEVPQVIIDAAQAYDLAHRHDNSARNGTWTSWYRVPDDQVARLLTGARERLAEAVTRRLDAADQEIDQLRTWADTCNDEANHWVGVVLDLTQLVRDLADLTPCSNSAYGGCHAHGWPQADPPCPHARARDILTAQKAGEHHG